MNELDPVARRAHRVEERERTQQLAAERRAARATERARAARQEKLRKLAFGGIVVAVLAVGTYLAFGDFLRRPADTAASGVIDVQSSMAGFTPSEIHVKAGATVTFKWWTQDAAVHLQGGVHTMISPDLGLAERLPAEGTRLVTWTVPDKPGTYDVWCESCCGGKDAPQMHGKIVVEPASAADVSGQALG
jgi:heme/copper-type cytochrome/quinol oxidase subunit 2